MAGSAVVLALLLLSACTVKNAAYAPQADGASPVSSDIDTVRDAGPAGDTPGGADKDTGPDGPQNTQDAPGADAKPCTHQTFYDDADGDAFGDPAQPVVSCAAPPGHVANKLDCDDLDPAAHPGQNSFYTVPTKGEGDFDYDCDKQEEQEYAAFASCVWKASNCVGDGWSGAVPGCGQEGVFVECQKKSGRVTGCIQVATKKTQGCR